MSKKSKARKEQRNQKAGVSSIKLSQVPGFRATQEQIHSAACAIHAAMTINEHERIDITFPHVADDVQWTLVFIPLSDDKFEVQLERTGYIAPGPIGDFFAAYKTHLLSTFDGGSENYVAALRDLQDALARLFMAKVRWMDIESGQFVPAARTKWTRIPA